MGRNNRNQRVSLLDLARISPDEPIEISGYLKIDTKSSFFTFTSPTILSSGVKIESHINLPKSKILKKIEITNQDTNKCFIITGKPTTYISKGMKRGTLNFLDIRRK